MAKARLMNKETQEIRILDDSYVRIFPKTWDYAPKKGASVPEPAGAQAPAKKVGK